ncbi:MAG: hypothetical protein WCI73_02340 [Phycisphaerae bacterium]
MPDIPYPPGAQIVWSYREYDAIVDAFFAGHFELLVVLGSPGLAKSVSFAKRKSTVSHLINGWATPFEVYCQCFVHRHKYLIFDDSETLWEKRAGRLLIRSLCETKPYKTVAWASATPLLNKAGVPQNFETSSRVALIANRFSFGSAAETAAILDRAYVIVLDLPPEEIHRYVSEWFWDQEIFDYFGLRLQTLARPSVRSYVRAWELKNAGQDWRQMIDTTLLHDDKARWVQALEFDSKFPTVKAKEAEFIRQTGACHATYFNLRRALKAKGQFTPPQERDAPRYILTGEPPDRPDVHLEVDKAKQEDDGRADGTPTFLPGTKEDGSLPAPQDLDDPERPKKPHPHFHNGEKIPPDADPSGWLRRRLGEAMARGDYALAEKLCKMLQFHKQGESGEEGEKH